MKKLSVTIGICAYNEEKNIASLLRMLIKQKEDHITIKEIIVASDGSKDRTIEMAKSVHDTRIRIIPNTKSRGKSFRVNQILKQAVSEFVVFSDADIIPMDRQLIQRLCKPFHNKPRIVLTGGEEWGLPPQTITEEALNNLNSAYNTLVRRVLEKGRNVYGIRGAIYAVRRSFGIQNLIPTNLHCDDNYLYFASKKLGLYALYVPSARVWYRNPQSAKDQLEQGSRFLSTHILLTRYFDPTMISDAWHIPFSIQLRVLLYQVMRNPLAYLWLKILSLFCIINSIHTAQTIEGKYKTVQSSKYLFSYDK